MNKLTRVQCAKRQLCAHHYVCDSYVISEFYVGTLQKSRHYYMGMATQLVLCTWCRNISFTSAKESQCHSENHDFSILLEQMLATDKRDYYNYV